MTERELANKTATRIVRVDGNPSSTKVYYHATPVVTIFDNGYILLDTGGYRTVTTKRRMNQVSEVFSLNFRVYARNSEWFISYNGTEIPFTYRAQMLGAV